MPETINPYSDLPQKTCDFYRAGIQLLLDAGVEFLVGGAYALGRSTGIERRQKDFDIFVRPEDAERTLQVLAGNGYRTELTFPHWLGKAFSPDGEDFIDVIYSSGNGIAIVDDEWFTNAPTSTVFGFDLLLVPPEEMMWSKSFILERERYDGADVAHLLLNCTEALDWERLLRRFGENWRVLLSHLILFGFIYPTERMRIPRSVMRSLAARLEEELAAGPPTGAEHHSHNGAGRVCRGTLISREQYLIDIEQWGYTDARLEPESRMSAADIKTWTDAIESRQKSNSNSHAHDKNDD